MSGTGAPRDLVILGSTGSIGTQALDIVDHHANELRVVGLAAGGGQLDLLIDQARRYRPRRIAIASLDHAQRHGQPLTHPHDRARVLAELAEVSRDATTGEPATVEVGIDAVIALAGCLDGRGIVLNGITGGVGLEPTLAALRSGAQLALANKESIVVGAHLVRQSCVRPGQITPVDSEHSAIAQCLLSGRHERGLTVPHVTGHSEVSRLILTASGGPFQGKTRADLADVTAAQALAHPTWTMGPVVTINSSTLMNKGLELIEASVLFDIPARDIIPVIHPQSIIHSMVEFCDGATIAQASPPDMHLPIALSLSMPDRWSEIEKPCQWDSACSWTFEPVDHNTFPAITLAREAVDASPTHPAVMNAANEVCVERFIRGQLAYLGIVDTVAAVLAEHDGIAEPTLEDVVAVEEWASARAAEHVATLAR